MPPRQRPPAGPSRLPNRGMWSESHASLNRRVPYVAAFSGGHVRKWFADHCGAPGKTSGLASPTPAECSGIGLRTGPARRQKAAPRWHAHAPISCATLARSTHPQPCRISDHRAPVTSPIRAAVRIVEPHRRRAKSRSLIHQFSHERADLTPGERCHDARQAAPCSVLEAWSRRDRANAPGSRPHASRAPWRNQERPQSGLEPATRFQPSFAISVRGRP